MARKKNNRVYPLQLILRPHGTAELVNKHDEILWASDADDDFREAFNNEFLSEDDFDEVLDWLYHNEVIDDEEFDSFDSEEWDMTVESLDGEALEEADSENDEED